MAADCKFAPGVLVPRIDRNRCEGRGDCVRACPYQVFDLRVLAPQERAHLTVWGKMRSWAHGWKQAEPTRADLCRGCGLCVSACPTRAITLQRA
jgi:4Fe-4S ferredoxin